MAAVAQTDKPFLVGSLCRLVPHGDGLIVNSLPGARLWARADDHIPFEETLGALS
jgi:hypothetical protein